MGRCFHAHVHRHGDTHCADRERAMPHKTPRKETGSPPQHKSRTHPLRAQEFAKEHNKRLSWCYAVDVPLHAGDRKLADDALVQKVQGWLSMHDEKTNHLASVFPLVDDLPVRLTDSIDRDLRTI